MDAFIGEIRLMGFGIVPRGWLACQGQLLAINQNQALFSLLGTTYGGNGQTTFGLPDLRGRAIVNQGAGTGLSPYSMGQRAGTESATLLLNQIPSHGHTVSGTLKASTGPESNSPVNAYPAATEDGSGSYSSATSNAAMSSGTVTGSTAANGGSQGHENRQPVLVMNYCICTQGYFPSRQ
jgi:microcystin-dependent protein